MGTRYVLTFQHYFEFSSLRSFPGHRQVQRTNDPWQPARGGTLGGITCHWTVTQADTRPGVKR